MKKGSLVRFGIVGVINTATGLFCIGLAKEFVGFGDAAANCAGYAVAMAVSFLLNKQWTFTFQGRSAAALLRFLTVVAIAYGANLVTVLGLIHLTSIDPLACQAAGIVPYSTLIYLGCRWYVFPALEPQSKACH